MAAAVKAVGSTFQNFVRNFLRQLHMNDGVSTETYFQTYCHVRVNKYIIK